MLWIEVCLIGIASQVRYVPSTSLFCSPSRDCRDIAAGPVLRSFFSLARFYGETDKIKNIFVK